MSEDDPITLAVAAQDFGLSRGVLKAEGLRGNLAIYRLGKAYYTTPNAVREWVDKCRVEPKARAYTLTLQDASGLSETERLSSARAAIRQTLQGQSQPSADISGLNSDPRLVLNLPLRKS